MNSTISLSYIPEHTSKLSDETILGLLKLIFYERKNIKQAARYYNINYVTAKKIVRQFQRNRLPIERKYENECKALFSFVEGKNKNHELIQSYKYDKFVGKGKSLYDKQRELNYKFRTITAMVQALNEETMENQELLNSLQIQMMNILEEYKKKHVMNYRNDNDLGKNEF